MTAGVLVPAGVVEELAAGGRADPRVPAGQGVALAALAQWLPAHADLPPLASRITVEPWTVMDRRRPGLSAAPAGSLDQAVVQIAAWAARAGGPMMVTRLFGDAWHVGVAVELPHGVPLVVASIQRWLPEPLRALAGVR